MATYNVCLMQYVNSRRNVLAHSNENFVERFLSLFFPPAPLSRVGSESLNYVYRMSRTTGVERNAAEINMYVKIGEVKVGSAKPVYPRGTRASRAANLLTIAS